MNILYYKKIIIDDYEEIVESVKTFLTENGYVTSESFGYIPLPAAKMLAYCPKLELSFRSLGLEIKSIAIFKSISRMPTRIHVDTVEQQSRINIPILNCENSHTVFYKATVLESIPQPYKGIKYNPCVDAVEMDRTTIDQPTIIRVDQPHQVLMDKFNSPRICLTVGTTPDPIELLNS